MYHFFPLRNGLCCSRMAQKTPLRGHIELSLACGSLDPYLPKNTSNCGTYSEPDPFSPPNHATGKPRAFKSAKDAKEAHYS